MRRRRPGIAVALAVVIVALLVAGLYALVSSLTGDSDKADALHSLQLRASDLPGGYARTVAVAPSTACSAPQLDADTVRRMRALGANACAVTKYRRPSPLGLAGLSLYRFDDAKAATGALAEMRRGYLADVGGKAVASRHSVPAGGLGDEAPRGVRIVVGGRGGGALYAFFWRRGNVVAVLGTGGETGAFNGRTALQLGRTVDARASS
jgi:hypothetical protein